MVQRPAASSDATLFKMYAEGPGNPYYGHMVPTFDGQNKTKFGWEWPRKLPTSSAHRSAH